MFGFLTTRVLMWICAALAAALAVAGVAVVWERHELKVAHVERDAYELAANNALDANKTNAGTISSYKHAIAQWQALAATAPDLAKQLAQLQRELDELNARGAEYAHAKEADRVDPDCDALLRTDIERVCPAVARSLRRAAGGD